MKAISDSLKVEWNFASAGAGECQLFSLAEAKIYLVDKLSILLCYETTLMLV